MKNAPQKMLNGWILLKVNDKSDSAVYTGQDEKKQKGEVVAVSSKFIQNGTMFTIGNFDVSKGDIVVFQKHKGLDTPKEYEDQNLMFVHYLDIMAIEDV